MKKLAKALFTIICILLIGLLVLYVFLGGQVRTVASVKKVEGTNLNTLTGVSGDQRSQGCISDIVSGEEDCIQQSVGKEEEMYCAVWPQLVGMEKQATRVMAQPM